MEYVVAAIALNKLYDVLGKEPLEELYKSFQDKSKNLDRLNSNLSAVEATFKAFHHRRITDPNLLDWIPKLKDAAFDAEDVMDAVLSEALRCEQRRLSHKLLDFFSRRNPVLFRCRIGRKIRKVLNGLDHIAGEKKFHLGSTGGAASRDAEQRQSHSFVSRDTVVKRERDKEVVVNLLVEEGEELDWRAVAIVGMAGYGKTTLAKVVYNDLKLSFDKTAWVSVGEDFSLKTIAKKILEDIDTKCGFLELNAVRRCVVNAMEGQKLLVVLDDVWNDRIHLWEEVRDLLRCGAPGSRVLVTTRNEMVAKDMGAKIHQLDAMSDEECWILFKQIAFEGRANADPPAEKVIIGKEIAKKSMGVPLVAAVLGRLMISKTRTEQWKEVRDNEIWDCVNEDPISPAWRLSYFDLPRRSKPCFAYCAIFRKGCKLYKDVLIQQWIANGFVLPRGRRELESIADEIFDDLLVRGLLQEGEIDGNGNIESYKMHDMAHDLSSLIAKNECRILTGDQEADSRDHKMIRFLSACKDTSSPQIIRFRRLRVLLVSELPHVDERFLAGVLGKLTLLRVLDLSHCKIGKVSKRIGKMIHLRYLDLSHTNITSLPGTMCSLVNLRTLSVSGSTIDGLPERIGDLTHLRCLDLSGTGITTLPESICSLVNLRTLRIQGCRIERFPDGFPVRLCSFGCPLSSVPIVNP